MTRENAIRAAILGELIPELEYAAPVLLERLERGDPLVGITSPRDLGFETGAVDSVLLELFKALAPYVNVALGWGVLRVIQAQQVSAREARNHAELMAKVETAIAQDARVVHAVELIASLLSRHEGTDVSVRQVVESIAAAADRVDEPEHPETDQRDGP